MRWRRGGRRRGVETGASDAVWLARLRRGSELECKFGAATQPLDLEQVEFAAHAFLDFHGDEIFALAVRLYRDGRASVGGNKCR